MLKKLAIAVCIAHLLIVIGLVTHHFATRRLKPARPIVIKTIIPQAPKQVIVSAPATPAPKQAAPPAKKSPPTPEKNKVATQSTSKQKPPAEPKSKAPTPKPTEQPKCKAALHQSPAPQSSVLKEIAESLETLNTEAARSRSTLTIPTKMKPKTEIAPSNINTDPTYGEFLVAFLQESLDLPEYGEVKAKIKIDRFGQLVSCEILEAKSRVNAEFLKNRLPDLTFPCLNDTQAFTITFRNVEIR